MEMRYKALMGSLVVVGLLLVGPGLALAHEEVELQGVVDILPPGSGGTLTLPLAQDAEPVTVLVSIGIPEVQIAVTITPDTEIEVEEGSPPVTLSDGDGVKIDAELIDGALVATELEVEDFPELELRGTVGGLPAEGPALPLAPGSDPVDFTLDLGVTGLDPLPVRLTSDTKVEDDPLTLMNEDLVQIEALVRDFMIVITELELQEPGEEEEEEEDDDEGMED